MLPELEAALENGLLYAVFSIVSWVYEKDVIDEPIVSLW